jgi:hypothetical protein
MIVPAAKNLDEHILPLHSSSRYHCFFVNFSADLMKLTQGLAKRTQERKYLVQRNLEHKPERGRKGRRKPRQPEYTQASEEN